MNFQCSRPLGLALLGESCTGNSADLACCTETEACDLVDAGTITCTGLPYLDNTGSPRTCKLFKYRINWIQNLRSDVCCGGPDNSGADSNSDSGTDNTDDDTLAGNSTVATDVTTAMDNHDSSSGQINISFFALLLAKLL